MKKIFAYSLIITALLLTSCGTQKQVALPSRPSAKPFGEVYSMPCEVYDTPEKFMATGIYRGSSYQKGQCRLNALENAKQVIYSKYKHSYEGIINHYSKDMGNNRGNDIATKIEREGNAVILAILDDVSETCIKFSNVFDDGMIECYVAIEVIKGEIAQKVSNRLSNVLTQEEKDRIDFNESNFRKQMEERMKNAK